MKTLGEAAMELPWLAPSVASLTTLAKSSLPNAWNEVRSDPGIVLLLARLIETPAQVFFPSDTFVLESVLRQQKHFPTGFVDWNQTGPATIQRSCERIALLSSQLALKLEVDTRSAWVAGFLAPLGWLALAAADAERMPFHLELLSKNTDLAGWQHHAWGYDHTALTRRMCRNWRLPAWIASIIGNLGLPASIVERLGAPTKLFEVVQLAISLLQARGDGLGLPLGATTLELLTALQFSADEADVLADLVVEANLAKHTWQSPADCPLLTDLLQLALDNRRQNDVAWVERLQRDVDCLQQALVSQCNDEKNRLLTAKLASLAEFAAGAGHEINNPLAVISGQAQYVLKQMDWLNVPAEEIENVGEYMEGLREKVTPSLTKIVGQTQRIHGILTDLMHFARPSKPRLQPLSARTLIQEVMQSWQSLAEQRKVHLSLVEIAHDEMLHADLAQTRTALGALFRNAIEAAPAGGWAGIRIEKTNGQMLELIIEDNGPGPAPSSCEHLFDPFFSGRSAGRGRGLGLPTAWRFARQQGGDVRFDGNHDGVTRFILSLPLAPAAAPAAYANGNGRNGTHTAAEAHAN